MLPMRECGGVEGWVMCSVQGVCKVEVVVGQ